MYNRGRNIHFVGIGGSGMSGIAELLLNLGHNVSGSDIARSEVTERLVKLGAEVQIGHSASNIKDAEVVVISSAVTESNVEVASAKENRVAVIQRAEMLAELMRLKYGVAVAGTHGKTTTTSLVGSVLTAGGLDPTIVVGGRLKGIGTGAKLGRGDFLVAEADESDGSFLRLSPTIAVVTNIDAEHLDFYGDLKTIKETFLKFINHLPFYGAAVLCIDDENIKEIINGFEKRFITYGFSSEAEVTAVDIKPVKEKVSFTVLRTGKKLGTMTLGMSGRHNVSNALAAVSVGLELNLPFMNIKEGLESFEGVQRRFQMKGEKKDVTVIDDYGHHPTEIAATLKAVRDGWPERRVITVFQPHRYTRTRDIGQEFSKAFHDTDLLIVSDIYAAGEEPIPGVSVDLILDAVRESGHKSVEYIKDIKDIASGLDRLSRPGDIIITMGAGDVWKAGEQYLEQ